jgi:hypothetical protein
MTRWTLVALAIALSACNKGERDRTPNTSATPAVDSAGPADSVSAQTRPSDSTTVKTAATDTKALAPARTKAATDKGPTGAEAMGGVRAAPAPRELSTGEVKQLQAALNKAGCNAGKPDGMTGRGTQRAIECALKKYKLGANDMSELYRKLGLSF